MTVSGSGRTREKDTKAPARGPFCVPGAELGSEGDGCLQTCASPSVPGLSHGCPAARNYGHAEGRTALHPFASSAGSSDGWCLHAPAHRPAIQHILAMPVWGGVHPICWSFPLFLPVLLHASAALSAAPGRFPALVEASRPVAPGQPGNSFPPYCQPRAVHTLLLLIMSAF